ncbi:hypothetical protein [Pseudotabrizicola alkalilacus]|uniref:Uncharacterized protein n=1 Tax=Pseudotabrizicola alkalilacus TaxID=2305252 RepID=A0A411Z823_9RHOB|nr:hypothetical protein [Pseudotabrizicola alkalilacus]RGP39176.1 hypothetical protein D1012_03460 [Pseudotabrizicola alkalilacus]
MSLLGRLRAALGRDDASLLARARGDVRMGLGLNPPACLAPLNRAIAALERLPNTPEVALLLGRALRAKAQALTGKPARILRARSVAKLRAMIEQPRISVPERAALWAALAQAWLPLPEDATDPDRSYRQLLRAEEAQTEALVIPSAATHLAMAEILLALCRSPLCPDAHRRALSLRQYLLAARALAPDADERHTADILESDVLQLFPGLAAGDAP